MYDFNLNENYDELKEQMGLEGTWHYRDLPRMSPELFDQLIQIMGEKNIQWITLATYKEGSIRGQMFYNETARLNVSTYLRGTNEIAV